MPASLAFVVALARRVFETLLAGEKSLGRAVFCFFVVFVVFFFWGVRSRANKADKAEQHPGQKERASSQQGHEQGEKKHAHTKKGEATKQKTKTKTKNNKSKVLKL